MHAKCCDAAFDAGNALAPGTRVDGRNGAHTSQMARITTGVGATPAVRTAVGANHYWFVGVEFRVGTGFTDSNTLIELGSDASTTPEASDIFVDRCYVHGNATGNHKRGIAMNGARIAVINSHVAEIHHTSPDANALNAWNGPGPFAIINNRIEGSHVRTIPIRAS